MKIVLLTLIACLAFSCSDEDKIYYEIKGDEVLYHSVYRKGQEYYTKAHETTVTLEEADANTFQQLTKYYGVDETSVFNEARKLIKRDPVTFKVLNRLVTTDTYGAYYDNNIIPNSHGLSFRFLNSDYAIDDNQVYYMPNSTNRVILKADKATFATLGDNNSDFAKDKNRVYYQGEVIKDANPDSFKMLTNDFSKDGVAIFYKKEQLNEADYDSFKMLNNEAIQENNYQYFAEDHKNRYGNNGDSVIITKKSELKNEN